MFFVTYSGDDDDEDDDNEMETSDTEQPRRQPRQGAGNREDDEFNFDNYDNEGKVPL